MKLKNEALKKLYDKLASGTLVFSISEQSPIDKAFAECDEELSESVTFEHIKNLQDSNDILRKSEATLLEANAVLASKKRQFEKDLDDAKKQLKYFTLSRDDWRARAKHAEKEVEDLKETLKKANADRTELQKDRDSYCGLYTELRKDYDKLFEENKQISELRRENAAMHELIDIKNEEISQRIKNYQDLSIKLKRCQINVGKESRYLWDMLQMVRDVKPEEFDPECETLGDVIDMDLEDFLDAYKKWEEEKKKKKEEEKKKEVESMRSYLMDFCIERSCRYCPLHSTSFKCGRGIWFDKIPDDEIKKYYDRVMEINKPNPPSYFRSTIEAVFTAEAKINKDLLKDICGIKPKEEEHKLEYGDAVRLPWCDCDYMYIGPDEKEETLVHLFYPENHAIVTTHISNVRYNGGRILVSEEDDIRKIWKYMK